MLTDLRETPEPIDEDVGILLRATGIDELPPRISARHLNNLARWLNKEKAFSKQDVYITDLPERLKAHLGNTSQTINVTYRTERPGDLFGGSEFTEGTGLRDFLFTVDLAHAKDNLCDASISKLRLYLAELNWQAILKGFDRERNINFCCQLMAKGLVNRSKLGLQIVDEYVNLSQTNTNFRVGIWLQRLKLLWTGGSNLDAKNKKDLDEFILSMSSAISGKFKHLNTATNKKKPIPLHIRISTVKSKAQTTLPVVTTGLRPGQPQISGVAAANIECYRRIQNSFLINDPAASYYWPKIVSKEFSECCANLLNLTLSDRAQITEQFISGLISTIASHTGLSFQQILKLSFSNEANSSLWSISIEQNQLLLIRARPSRTGSVALPDEIKQYCIPIGTELKFVIHQFDDDEHASVIHRLTYQKSVADVLSKVAAGEFHDQSMANSLQQFILRNLPNISFFTEIAIRRQAYKTLINLLDEPTAELCIAQQEESTSAITGYLSHLNANGINVAGSKIVLTKSGVRELVQTITDQIYESMDELPENVDPLEIFNIATTRLYILQLICTGIRPVRTGIQSLGEIDLNNQIALVCDKYVEGFEQIRVIPIVDTLKNEINKLRKLLESLSVSDHIPIAVRSQVQEMLNNAGKSPLWMILKTAKQGIFAKEINAKVALSRFAPLISKVPNIFRHFLAQQVFEKSKSIELTMSALGHSDSVRMLYGPASTRCRRDDVAQIRKIMDSALSHLQFGTEKFWSLAYKKLEYALNTENKYYLRRNDSKIHRLDTWGYQKRNQNRQRDDQNRIKKIETLLDQYVENTKGEINKEKAEDLLKDILFNHPTISKKSLNSALKKKKWPAVVSTYSSSQLFPSKNLPENLQRRTYFENWFRKHSNHFTLEEQLAAKLIKLIYFHGAYSQPLATRCLSPKHKNIVEDMDGTIYLQISRSDTTLTSYKNTQIFRIPIPRNMIDLGHVDLTRLRVDTRNLKLLAGNYPSNTPIENFESLVKIICNEARDIALYDQPAFQSYTLSNDLPGASTTYATLLSFNNMQAPRIYGTGEITESDLPRDHTLYSFNDINPGESIETGISNTPNIERRTLAKNLKLLRKALKTLFGAELKDLLQQLAKTNQNLIKESNWMHLVAWVNYSIFERSGPKLKPKSTLRYLRSTQQMLKVLHGTDLYSMDREEIEIYLNEYLNWLEKERDRDNLKQGLKSFLIYLEKNINSNFADFDISINSKVKSVNANWITPRQYHNVIQCLWDSRKEDKEALEKIRFLSTQYHFGMRINETVGVEFRDLFHFNNRLLGVAARKNQHRDIKNDKPPRYIFLDEQAQFSKIENVAWDRYFSEVLKEYFQVPRNLKVFNEFTKRTNWQEQFKNQIKVLCKNPNLTFHGLRKGFTQNQFSQRVQIAQNFLTLTGLASAGSTPNSRALEVLRRCMGHASLDTTFTSYLHTMDQVIKQTTKGRRRGYALDDDSIDHEKAIIKLRELAEAEKIDQETTRSIKMANDQAELSLANFNLHRIKELIRIGSVQVNSYEASFLSTIINSDVNYHPEAPRITLLGNRITITAKKKNSFQSDENFQTLIRFLDTITTLPVKAEELSTINLIVARGGEIVLRSAKDFEFLRFFGEALPTDFELNYPDSLTSDQVTRLKSKFDGSAWLSKLKPTLKALPNEVSAERICSVSRVCVRSAKFHKPHDILIILVAAILVQLEKQATGTSHEQESNVLSEHTTAN
ncbi:MAG: hypothetical protein DCE89_07995 [Betaproteobacteria bacterium]|nr:MAG: hypothetical protein DCE89_07995 [Betaproteobacteria bacterium]